VLTALTMFAFGGPWLVIGGMSIMLAHELGHYFACRYYGIDATLPFFIPFPSLVGTLGAFIRIRGPIPHRRALFDVGIAGPLMGFVVALPVLVFGFFEASLVPTPPPDPRLGFQLLGDPLLLQGMTRLFMGPVPEGMTVSIGGLGLAGWFGLLLTGLNLIPIGQLDGGHVVYALLRGKAEIVSRVAFWACVGLAYFGPSWLLWAVLLLVIGRRHPPTLDDEQPIGQGRVLVGLLGLAVFVVSFIPNPMPEAWDLLRAAFTQG
jgi:membrane-associated protease RseP (regulator of RpoE activity)